MADLHVSVTAGRFVDAVVALRLVRLYWRRLDNALVRIPNRHRLPGWQEAWDALEGMDHAIANATDGLLTVAEGEEEPAVTPDALVSQPLVQHAGEYLDARPGSALSRRARPSVGRKPE